MGGGGGGGGGGAALVGCKFGEFTLDYNPYSESDSYHHFDRGRSWHACVCLSVGNSCC